MISSHSKSKAAFTLVELLIGMSLSLMVMGAVLSSYVFLGRSFSRSLGVSSATEPNLEAQGRRTLAHIAQDVRMASALILTPNFSPSENTMTLAMSTSAGSKKIAYFYNHDLSPELAVPGFVVPKRSLVRIDLETSSLLVLHSNLLTCAFSYYDATGEPYVIFDPAQPGFSSFSGIKQISIEFTAQGGLEKNKTLTPIYSAASQRLIMRNKQLFP